MLDILEVNLHTWLLDNFVGVFHAVVLVSSSRIAERRGTVVALERLIEGTDIESHNQNEPDSQEVDQTHCTERMWMSKDVFCGKGFLHSGHTCGLGKIVD